MEDDMLALENARLELDRERLAFERRKHDRERWWLEEGVINQRLTWLLTAQGFLAAGYAWIAQLPDSPATRLLKPLAAYLPLFGIALCAVVLLGLVAAHRAQDRLMADDPGGGIGNSTFIRAGGRLVPILIALLFALGWLCVHLAR